VLIDLPDIGSQLKTNEKYADLESDKTTSEVFMPMGGEVIEVNEIIIKSPAKINEVPYESWLIKIKVKDIDEYEEL